MDKFRFSGKYIHLTYKTHLNAKEIIKHIEIKSKREILCKIAHETGDEHHPYPHTHILIYFKLNRINTRNSRYFDFVNIHPHIQPITDNLHWLRTVEYLSKENCIFNTLIGCEFDNTGHSKELIETIWSHTLFRDVCCDPIIANEIAKKLNWARIVFNARPRINYSNDIKLKFWQKNCIRHIEAQDDRKVLWVYDEKGGKGKSVLTNYLIDRKNAFFCNGGAMKDISFAYNNENIVVFDLPRSSHNDETDWTPYRAMECFKDGRLFSPKYESCMKRFSPAKVIIFSNFLPNKRKLSNDRWDIIDLSEKWISKSKIASLTR